MNDPLAVQIDGTEDIDESILCVPMRVGDHVNGVIVLSNLGVDQFDDEDIRVMEVLASHAAVAFENARLLQQERRRGGDGVRAAWALAGPHGRARHGHRPRAAVAAVPTLLDGSRRRRVRPRPFDRRVPAPGASRPRRRDARRARARSPARSASPLLASLDDPFVLPAEASAARAIRVPPLGRAAPRAGHPAASGIPTGSRRSWRSRARPPTRTTNASLALARGIRDIASLALGSARRVPRARAVPRARREPRRDLLGGRADGLGSRSCRGGPPWSSAGRRRTRSSGRGATTFTPTISSASSRSFEMRSTAAPNDLSLEYRALGPEGEPMWLRDLVHVATRCAERRRRSAG